MVRIKRWNPDANLEANNGSASPPSGSQNADGGGGAIFVLSCVGPCALLPSSWVYRLWYGGTVSVAALLEAVEWQVWVERARHVYRLRA